MRKARIVIAFVVASYGIFLLPAAARGAARLAQDFSDNWRFQLTDDAGIESRDYRDDRRWPTVNLPHTWNTKDTFDDEPGYYRGIGWYRKEFQIPAAWAGRRIVVRFEAAFQVADVWVNNVYQDRHKGGHTPFEFDITDAVETGGGRNIMAVRVDSRWRRDIPPYDMDFNFMGGLYREVSLLALDPIHIVSTRVTTPRVSESEAVAAFEIELRNDGGAAGKLEVVTEVRDPGGAEVFVSRPSPVSLRPGETVVVRQETGPIRKPRLWSPDAPNLYQVTVNLRAGDQSRLLSVGGGEILDDFHSPLGFRWYRFDPNEGFYLNGRRLKLRGTNRHDDYPGLGWALPQSRQVKDMELIKGMGCNFVRLAHYSQHPVVLETCDRIGLLVWEEIPFDGEGEQRAPYTGAVDFATTTKQLLREMIRRDRNHPCVILWSMGNENLNGATISEWQTVSDLTRELAELSRKEDPTRPTTVAINLPERAFQVGMMEHVDVVGYNIYAGWYSGTFDDIAPNVDLIHRKYPNKPLIISEYGAGMELGRHTETPQRYDFSEEWGCLFHETYLDVIDSRPFIAGSLIWNIFDFGVEDRLDQTIPHLNQKGIFDYYRRPKDVYYLYLSRWTEAPMAYIVSHTWTERQGSPGETRPIRVYSNCDSVELFLNDQSLGRQEKRFVWPVAFAPGTNRLRAVGIKDGKQVVDSMEVRY